MDFTSFISKEALVLVVAIYALGMMLKGVSKIPDWSIPWILLIIAFLLSFGILGISVNAIIQAILVTASAVYTNQLVKQTSQGIFKNNVPEIPKEIDPTSTTEFRK